MIGLKSKEGKYIEVLETFKFMSDEICVMIRNVSADSDWLWIYIFMSVVYGGFRTVSLSTCLSISMFPTNIILFKFWIVNNTTKMITSNKCEIFVESSFLSEKYMLKQKNKYQIAEFSSSWCTNSLL